MALTVNPVWRRALPAWARGGQAECRRGLREPRVVGDERVELHSRTLAKDLGGGEVDCVGTSKQCARVGGGPRANGGGDLRAREAGEHRSETAKRLGSDASQGTRNLDLDERRGDERTGGVGFKPIGERRAFRLKPDELDGGRRVEVDQ